MHAGAERYAMKMKHHDIAVIVNNFEFCTIDPSKKALPVIIVDKENLCVTWEYLQNDV